MLEPPQAHWGPNAAMLSIPGWLKAGTKPSCLLAGDAQEDGAEHPAESA